MIIKNLISRIVSKSKAIGEVVERESAGSAVEQIFAKSEVAAVDVELIEQSGGEVDLRAGLVDYGVAEGKSAAGHDERNAETHRIVVANVVWTAVPVVGQKDKERIVPPAASARLTQEIAEATICVADRIEIVVLEFSLHRHGERLVAREGEDGIEKWLLLLVHHFEEARKSKFVVSAPLVAPLLAREIVLSDSVVEAGKSDERNEIVEMQIAAVDKGLVGIAILA